MLILVGHMLLDVGGCHGAVLSWKLKVSMDGPQKSMSNTVPRLGRRIVILKLGPRGRMLRRKLARFDGEVSCVRNGVGWGITCLSKTDPFCTMIQYHEDFDS